MSAAAWLWLAAPGALLWCAILLLPWRPWLAREVFESDAEAPADLSDVTVLIPARNEWEVIGRTIIKALAQGGGIRIAVIDDQSTDGTAGVVRAVLDSGGEIIQGAPPPEGWSGKLWALEQGMQHVRTRWVLLLDADIELERGIVASALARMQREGLQALSLMAWLRMESP
jgi:cellulose synthase/poly-beta-1,6-N-acetylglucosamine synthase-like glycosyltransferase